MEFKTKTSTHKLVTQKDAKKLKKTPIHKYMNEILGVEEFLDIQEKNQNVTALIKSKIGYSMILKVSSSDPYLLSEADLNAFENTLLSFCYGLDFDIKLIRSNRKQDFKKYIQFIEKLESKIKCTDYVKNYKKSLFEELHKMEKQTGINIKANYIVVYSKDSNDAVAKKELFDRANYIMRHLQDNNFRANVVGNFELLEFFYRNFHRDIDIDLETFVEQDAFELVTSKVNMEIEPVEITADTIQNFISQKEKQEAEEELRRREELKPSEYKKYMKKLEKEKLAFNKKHKKDMEDLNLLQTGIIEVLKPDVFAEKSDYIQLGSNSFVRCLSVTTLPATMNIHTLNDLNALENMEIHIDLIKLNDARMSKTLRAESNKIISNIHLKEQETGTMEHAQRKLASNIEGLIQAIETNSDRLFGSQIIVKLWSDNLIDLENKTRTIKENFANAAMDLKVLFYDQKNAFMNTMPTPIVKFKENFKNITAGGASCLIPSGCTHLRHQEGRFIGRSLLTNYPIILDHFICQKDVPESEMYSNPNVYVVGKPGSGKSVFMKLQIARSMFMGDLHVVLDPHSEYKKMTDKLGGKYIYLRNGKKTGINPLEIKVAIDEVTGEKIVPISEKIAEVTSLISNFIAIHRDGNGLKGIEITNVTNAVKNVYTKFGITDNPDSLYTVDENGNKKIKVLPILSDLREEIEVIREVIPEISEVAEMMKIITGDGIMSLFDCQTDESIAQMLDTRLVCFSLKELDDLTKTYAMTTILNWLWSMFSNWELAGIQKNVEIDEGWRLANHPQSLAILENFARSGRKYLISLIIASQSINEFSSTQGGMAILDFCSFKYIFRQDARLSAEIGKFFALSNSAIKSLPNFQKGQCIISTELGNLMGQVDLFDIEKDFATTSGGLNENE